MTAEPVEAVCWCCGCTFSYVRKTKPRRYCSAPCELRRSELLRSEKRRERMKARGLSPSSRIGPAAVDDGKGGA